MGQAKRRALKQILFERDGWQDEDGAWRAECSFGCGFVLDFRHATIDRFPVPGREGGCYIASNTRLACGPCNSEDGGNYNRDGGVQGYIPPMTKTVREAIRREKRDELYQQSPEAQTERQRRDVLKTKHKKLARANSDVEGRSNQHGIRMDLQ